MKSIVMMGKRGGRMMCRITILRCVLRSYFNYFNYFNYFDYFDYWGYFDYYDYCLFFLLYLLTFVECVWGWESKVHKVTQAEFNNDDVHWLDLSSPPMSMTRDTPSNVYLLCFSIWISGMDRFEGIYTDHTRREWEVSKMSSSWSKNEFFSFLFFVACCVHFLSFSLFWTHQEEQRRTQNIPPKWRTRGAPLEFQAIHPCCGARRSFERRHLVICGRGRLSSKNVLLVAKKSKEQTK